MPYNDLTPLQDWGSVLIPKFLFQDVTLTDVGRVEALLSRVLLPETLVLLRAYAAGTESSLWELFRALLREEVERAGEFLDQLPDDEREELLKRSKVVVAAAAGVTKTVVAKVDSVEKQQLYLDCLLELGNGEQARKAANIGPQTPYTWANRSEQFKEQWHKTRLAVGLPGLKGMEYITLND